MTLRKRTPKQRLSLPMKKLLDNLKTYALGEVLDIMDIDSIQLKAMRNTNARFDEEFLKALGITKNQELFLNMFYQKGGNTRLICDSLGIHITTYYHWINTNAVFSNYVNIEREAILDFGDSMLMKNIQDGKESSLLFLLKTKGKDRGYVERSESVVTNTTTLNIKAMSDDERDAKIAEYEKILNGDK